jgi:formate dehydrogenase major subunit
VAATWIKNAVKRHALILAEPRHSSSRATTHFLQIKPDSDVALLNAMMHVIVEKDSWPRASSRTGRAAL